MKRITLLFTMAICLVSGTVIGTSEAAVTQRADGLVLCSAGDTFTLPTAANKPGRVYRLKNTGASTCTVATTSAQTIDGASTWSVLSGWQVTFTSDGGNWVAGQSSTDITDKQKLATLATGGWGDVQEQRMRAAVPNVNTCFSKPAQDLPASASWTDALITGGGKTAVQNTWAAFTGPIINNPKTSEWAVVARFRHSDGGHAADIGVIDGGNYVMIALLGSSTKLYALKWNDGTLTTKSGALSMDTNYHDAMLAKTTTSMKVFIDGVEVVSETDLAHVFTSVGTFKTATYSGTDLTITDFAYCVVR